MNYADIKKVDVANGEGVRVSVFVSGCNHHCKGCFNKCAWDFNYGEKFTQEVLKSENTMYHIAKGMLKSESDCEDVVSEAVLKAYTKIHTLKEEKYFKTWLIRILINECYKKLREYKRVVSIEDCNNSFEYKDNSNYTELYNAVKKLKHKIRIVIMLHYIEGYSVEEVGNILKIPVGTVKSRLHIGRKNLKEELEDE